MTKERVLVLPRTIDEHAEEYLKLVQLAEVAKVAVDEKKDELVKLAKKNGSIPEGAEKSLRLSGSVYDITASFGTSSSIDEVVVDKIKAELEEARTPRLFCQIFQEKKSYIVAPTGPTIVENLSAKVRKLFARVMTTKPKSPSLKVEKRKAGAKKGGAK
jgi:hypothetical protein